MMTRAFCIAGSVWFTLELPSIRTALQPKDEEMRFAVGNDIDLVSRGPESPRLGEKTIAPLVLTLLKGPH